MCNIPTCCIQFPIACSVFVFSFVEEIELLLSINKQDMCGFSATTASYFATQFCARDQKQSCSCIYLSQSTADVLNVSCIVSLFCFSLLLWETG